jgi:transposase
MHPLLRRTWAPLGRTPLLRHRTRHHRKVSCIGGLSASPKRRRMQWYLQFHTDTSIRQAQVIGFLKHLLRHLPGPAIVIWDRLNAHRGRQVRQWLETHRRITVEYLPPYAPELNPNEYGWSHLKNNDLANYCPEDVGQLQARVMVAATAARSRQTLLRGFFKASGLPLRLH